MTNDEFVAALISTGYTPELALKMAKIVEGSIGANKITKNCENCGGIATVYAMDTCAGGWGGRYCDSHIPTGFQITDRYAGSNK